VLSLGKLSLGQEAYYLSEVLDGAEDYYLNAGEAPGRWTGTGAAGLGLIGPVGAEELRAVLSGKRPDGTPLRATTASLPGIDVTLKAPKSVSIVWGLGDEEMAAAVVAAHEAAVDSALGYLEAQACHVRRGHGGVDVLSADGFVAAAFRHRTSRAGDPTLHSHVLVANMAQGADGRWSALDTRDLYTHGRTAGFVYQAVLRHRLAQSLGLLFEEMERGYADVAGVPKELRVAFSTRRGQILAAMEAHGATSAKAASAAALSTRAPKTEHVSEADLRRRWAEVAREYHWSPTDLTRLVRTPGLVIEDEDIAGRLTESVATFTRRDVVRAVAQAATQGASRADIEGRTNSFLGAELAIEVASGRWTTPEILELEGQTVARAEAGLSRGAGLASSESLRWALDARPSMGTDQAEAVRSLCTSGHAVQILIGPAGTGKTFSLDAARAAWEASGYRVTGTALAARAAAELAAEAGIASLTADRLLAGLASGRARLDERSVLVIDEAGMLGTRRLAALVGEATQVGAKVVLCGDPRQLPEIDAGGLFAALAHRLGYATLTENRRQRDPQERAALADLRAGQASLALDRLERHGRVVTTDNAVQLREAMVADWYSSRTAGDEALMLASRRSVVADLNEAARDLLMAEGGLGPEVLTVGELSFAVGDEVMAHHNDYRLGILNSEVGVVIGGDESGLRIRLGGTRVVEVPLDYIEAGHLSHGYATTIHKAQGRSVDRVFVLGDDSFSTESGYTALTRGRDANAVYLVSPGRDAGHGLAPEIDPVVAFAQALGRSSAKTAAIDHLGPEGPIPTRPSPAREAPVLEVGP